MSAVPRRPPGELAPFVPQGRALRAWLDGRREACVDVHCADGESERVPVDVFFREPDAFETWERVALDACVGRVLDLGAGAGCHALALAARGHEVVALDTDAASVEVMRRRGVADARLGSLDVVEAASVDTVLALQHGVGLAGDLRGLHRMLDDVARVLRPGGRLLLDGRGPDHVEPEALAACPDDEWPGVAELWLGFDGVCGAPFRWLFVDWDRLLRVARDHGLVCELLHSGDDGRWVGGVGGRPPRVSAAP